VLKLNKRLKIFAIKRHARDGCWVTIVDSPQQFHEFGKIADAIKLDFSGLR
jgi:hypothetical protein